jgi:hypothetical protein
VLYPPMTSPRVADVEAFASATLMATKAMPLTAPKGQPAQIPASPL